MNAGTYYLDCGCTANTATIPNIKLVNKLYCTLKLTQADNTLKSKPFDIKICKVETQNFDSDWVSPNGRFHRIALLGFSAY